jgi:hypothetical protein
MAVHVGRGHADLPGDHAQRERLRTVEGGEQIGGRLHELISQDLPLPARVAPHGGRGKTAGLLADVDAVVSGIGIRKGDPPGTLVAGARAPAPAAPARLVWLGALGAGASASKAGPLYKVVMALFVGSERAEKEKPTTSCSAREPPSFTPARWPTAR